MGVELTLARRAEGATSPSLCRAHVRESSPPGLDAGFAAPLAFHRWQPLARRRALRQTAAADGRDRRKRQLTRGFAQRRAGVVHGVIAGMGPGGDSLGWLAATAVIGHRTQRKVSFLVRRR